MPAIHHHASRNRQACSLRFVRPVVGNGLARSALFDTKYDIVIHIYPCISPTRKNRRGNPTAPPVLFFHYPNLLLRCGGCLRPAREHPQPAVSEGRGAAHSERAGTFARRRRPLPRVNGGTHTSEGGRGTKCRERPISRWIPPQTPACSRSCAHPAPPASETDRPFRRFHPADGR